MDTKYTCTCGRVLSFHSVAKHLGSKLHRDLVEAKQEIPIQREEYIVLKKK
jgi:hypothetical protein